eukprot:219450-Prorocentrum_minimum.AAC.1
MGTCCRGRCYRGVAPDRRGAGAPRWRCPRRGRTRSGGSTRGAGTSLWRCRRQRRRWSGGNVTGVDIIGVGVTGAEREPLAGGGGAEG